MRRINWSYWLALGLLGAMLSGCATAEEKAAYLNAQLAALDKQKPILYFKARPGESIELKGVEELAVYSPLGGGNGGLIRQHQNEWAPVAREGLGILGMAAGGYTLERILQAYPELTVEDVSAALEYAAEVAANGRNVVPT